MCFPPPLSNLRTTWKIESSLAFSDTFRLHTVNNFLQYMLFMVCGRASATAEKILTVKTVGVPDRGYVTILKRKKQEFTD